MDLVRRTQSLSNLPALTEHELGQRAMDWQDAFEGIIPIDRLGDAFKRALETHESSFPVNGFEVLAAWKRIQESERREAQMARWIEEQEHADDPARCPNAENHKDDDRNVEFHFRFDDEPTLLPCTECRPHEYRREFVRVEREWKDRNADKIKAEQDARWEENKAAIGRIIENMESRRKCRPERIAESYQLIDRLLPTVHFEMQDEQDAEKKEKLRSAWFTLLRASKYARLADQQQIVTEGS